MNPALILNDIMNPEPGQATVLAGALIAVVAIVTLICIASVVVLVILLKKKHRQNQAEAQAVGNKNSTDGNT